LQPWLKLFHTLSAPASNSHLPLKSSGLLGEIAFELVGLFALR